jgi:ribosomal protein S18 acetylase RimI-like enzyme
MSDIVVRVVESFPEPAILALQRKVFADFEKSEALAQVLASEAATRADELNAPHPSMFRVAAFRGKVLVGWTQGYREGKAKFYMLNSGVAAKERRKGVYTRLVQTVLAHAETQGYSVVASHHVPANVPVIIAKLRLGFLMTGFEYSEVYGPLVRLTYVVGEKRRELYRRRAVPLRPADDA